jgi:hypothetical protein
MAMLVKATTAKMQHISAQFIATTIISNNAMSAVFRSGNSPFY